MASCCLSGLDVSISIIVSELGDERTMSLVKPGDFMLLTNPGRVVPAFGDARIRVDIWVYCMPRRENR